MSQPLSNLEEEINQDEEEEEESDHSETDTNDQSDDSEYDSNEEPHPIRGNIHVNLGSLDLRLFQKIMKEDEYHFRCDALFKDWMYARKSNYSLNNGHWDRITRLLDDNIRNYYEYRRNVIQDTYDQAMALPL
jgi:cobalamin biosynthesis protein CobT